MTRRITIPDDHVALVLSSQLADEAMSLLMAERNRQLALWRRRRSTDGDADAQHDNKMRADICGDLILNLLEAKEV